MGHGHSECSRTGCNARAEWRPVIVAIVAPGTTQRRYLRAVVGLRLCGFCRTKTKLADVLNDELWELIREAAGNEKPMRDLTSLDFCGINSRESKALVQRRPS